MEACLHSLETIALQLPVTHPLVEPHPHSNILQRLPARTAAAVIDARPEACLVTSAWPVPLGPMLAPS